MHKPAWQKYIFRFTVFMLAVSGLGQMPIFKRYYLADIPGLGWLADFYFLHRLHYVLAAIFLFFIIMWGMEKAALQVKKIRTISWYEWTVSAVILFIIWTGAYRILKNFPSLSVSPGEAMFIDIGHLVGAILFGLLSLGALVKRKLAPAARA